MKRTGVFICHCGINIAGTVDVKRVAEASGVDFKTVFDQAKAGAGS